MNYIKKLFCILWEIYIYEQQQKVHLTFSFRFVIMYNIIEALFCALSVEGALYNL